jgi:hypothetical protein
MNNPISPAAPGPLCLLYWPWFIILPVTTYPLIHNNNGSVSGLFRLSKYPSMVSSPEYSVAYRARTEKH